MSDYLNKWLDLICKAQVRAVESVVTADAYPKFFYAQEDFPYFINRISDSTADLESPQDAQQRTYTCTMRLVVAHLTQGYEGENEVLLYRLIPLVEDEFGFNHWLTDEDEDYVHEMDARGVVFERSTGLRVFQTTGIEATQIGAEFTLTSTFYIQKNRRY